MKLGELLTNVGGAALTTINPVLGGSIMALVNSFIGDDDGGGKITLENTGQDILNHIGLLDDSEKKKLLSQNVDVQIQMSKERINQSNNELMSTRMLTDNDVTKKAIEVSMKTVISTIAVYGILLTLIVVVQMCLISFSEVSLERIAMMKDLLPDWSTIAAIIGIPSLVIRSIFSYRTRDTTIVANAAVGQKTTTVTQGLKDIITGSRSK